MKKNSKSKNNQNSFNGAVSLVYENAQNIIITNCVVISLLLTFLWIGSGSVSDLEFVLSFLMTPLLIYILIFNTILYTGYMLFPKAKNETTFNSFLLAYIISPYILIIIPPIFI